ncbi:MAG TPA: hypothetical protein VNI53_06470 [Gammaproteobacteria bacterium]|nr:hypothetical protein [Gammaproteobacteria bacterium]
MKAKQLKMPDDRRVQMLFLVLAGLTTALWGNSGLAAGKNSYPTMVPIGEYLIASKTQEIALARSAAPASISDHAEVLVLGKHGYDIAVKGTNGFVCLVVRSWDHDFDKSGFWNPNDLINYAMPRFWHDSIFADCISRCVVPRDDPRGGGRDQDVGLEMESPKME